MTDSAASGTGWATGHKSYNNAVSIDPVTKKPLPTILELAQKAGLEGTRPRRTRPMTFASDGMLNFRVV